MKNFQLLGLKLLALTFVLFATAPKADVETYIYGPKDSSYNIWGESGIIVIPTAKVNKEGSLFFNLSSNEIFKYGSLTITPFNWLEASYFYYRPKDLWWTGPETKGLYIDKGFSVKISRKISEDLYIALGLSDFAGTGFFSREYIISSLEKKSFRFSLGLGFGKFATREPIKSPFSFLGDRPSFSQNIQDTGAFNVNQWFRGDATIISGIEYFFNGRLKNTSLKIEYDPFDYVNDFSVNTSFQGQDLGLRKKDSNINIGLHTNISENLKLGIYLIKGNTLNFNLSFGSNFSRPLTKKDSNKEDLISSQKGMTRKMKFYEDLLVNINRKDIFLQSAEISKSELKVAVATSKYRSPILVHSLVGDIAYSINQKHELDIFEVTTISTNVGLELSRIKSPISDFKNRGESIIELVQYNSEIQSGQKNEYQNFAFKPIIKYPASFTEIAPTLINHIGDPRRFYFGGLAIKLNNEIQFSSSLQLNSELIQNLANNFDEKASNPDSLLPHVRTDIVEYLQASETYIGRMQLDYFFSPKVNLFGKLSVGILEDMYSGGGIELLYKPFNKNLSFSFEGYRVRKRSFNRKLGLLDYEVNTGHLSMNYFFQPMGILSTLSYGRYLAGDTGFTFDLSRRLKSGFRAGFYFSRTNVGPELFGEGNFDKGFYFQIPIDLFFNEYSGGYIDFNLKPLTRDGGQKLKAGNDLVGMIHDSSLAEVSEYWGNFND